MNRTRSVVRGADLAPLLRMIGTGVASLCVFTLAVSVVAFALVFLGMLVG